MLIKSDFEVPLSPERCWEFFEDIPQVAACLPGATLDEEVGPDEYAGTVDIRLGPFRMDFAGRAVVRERDEESRTIVVDASGADEKGRGQAAMAMTARLIPTDSGTRIELEQDLELAGAAAQYGRGMINDVNAVLMRDFAANMQARIEALDRGLAPDQVQAAGAAGGLSIGLRAAWMALGRVGARFFLPYRPERV